MSELKRQEINGKMATVAYLSGFGGKFVEPKDAKVVIANFDNGEKAIYFPAGESKK